MATFEKQPHHTKNLGATEMHRLSLEHYGRNLLKPILAINQSVIQQASKQTESLKKQLLKKEKRQLNLLVERRDHSIGFDSPGFTFQARPVKPQSLQAVWPWANPVAPRILVPHLKTRIRNSIAVIRKMTELMAASVSSGELKQLVILFSQSRRLRRLRPQRRHGWFPVRALFSGRRWLPPCCVPLWLLCPGAGPHPYDLI